MIAYDHRERNITWMEVHDVPANIIVALTENLTNTPGASSLVLVGQ